MISYRQAILREQDQVWRSIDILVTCTVLFTGCTIQCNTVGSVRNTVKIDSFACDKVSSLHLETAGTTTAYRKSLGQSGHR